MAVVWPIHLAAKGYKIGKSLVEADKIDLAKELLIKAEKKNVKLYLPVDLVMSEAFAADAKNKAQDIENLDQSCMALDIGPKTAALYADALKSAKMIVWNGPMGVFEMDAFCKGTEAVAKAVALTEVSQLSVAEILVAAIDKLGT